MGGTCSTHGIMRNEYKIVIGKPEDNMKDLDVDGREYFGLFYGPCQ
jgi:hypothetical protein